MFEPGRDHLDPRVFTLDEHMRDDVRQGALDRLDVFMRPRCGGRRTWTRVYLAGSEASYWWDSDIDFDVLLGVDLEELTKA